MSEIDWVHKDSTTIKEVNDIEIQTRVIDTSKDYIIEKLQQENNLLKEQKKQVIECIHLFGIYKDTPDEGLDIRKILKNILEILGDKK